MVTRMFPIEFALFGLTLVGVSVFHTRTLTVALIGLAAIVAYLSLRELEDAAGAITVIHHVYNERVELLNLFLLLTGFALLADKFERSNLPDALPKVLPQGWQGGLALLALVFALSGVLDNIAAALVGATIARHVFGGKVHLAFVAAIVAAANAGGAGSVLGDTTTTMMWVAGVNPLSVLHAYAGALAAFAVFAPVAAVTQHRYSPAQRSAHAPPPVDRVRVVILALAILAAATVNVLATLYKPGYAHAYPILGLTLWAAMLAGALLRAPDFKLLGPAAKGAMFLLALVVAASLMPVESLPAPSIATALGLGAISAVFDNIPLTALALSQGGYDWGVLAYAVGIGGSMIWFGSSAGIAIAGQFPEAKSTLAWLRAGWPIAIGYFVGFGVLIALFGWRPD
jgi:Na+/H+ antiporter NhaD/arsenite permease-like protein